MLDQLLDPSSARPSSDLSRSLDFVADTLVSGRRFRILTVVDDFSGECLAWWVTQEDAF